MHPEWSKRLVSAQLEEALSTAGLFSSQVELEEYTFPTFFVRFRNRSNAVRLLRFDCTDYDFQAIDVEPVRPDDRRPLPVGEWLLRDGGPFPSHHMKGNGPFFCITGTRAYYTHEGHTPQVTGERWEARRPDFKIVDLIAMIRDRFASGRWM